MTEEPFRWLEAIENRREYVLTQIAGGTPVFSVSLPDGILLLGVGSGHSKVFELFDRHAMAGLGHPADLEKIRQVAIDAAHMEAFTRAPEDVSLRRLVGFGLGLQLKTNFEQIYSAPFLIELVFAELGREPADDLLLRLHFDGTFQTVTGGCAIATSLPESEAKAQTWLTTQLAANPGRDRAAELVLQLWWCLSEQKPIPDGLPDEETRRAGWRKSVAGKTVEIGWLARQGSGQARFKFLSPRELGL